MRRLGFCLAIVAALLSMGKFARSSDWKPDPETSAKLLGPSIPFDGFSMRPPKGYLFAGTHKEAWGEVFFPFIAGRPREGDIPFGFTLTTQHMSESDRTAIENLPLDTLATIFLRNFFKIWGKSQISPFEHGSIQGIPFVRCTWTAKSSRGVAVTGLTYVAVFQQHPITMMACAPADDATKRNSIFAACDQAALSFTPVSAVGRGDGVSAEMPLAPAQEIEPGILLHQVTLRRRDSEIGEHLWIYLPKSSEIPGTTKIPCMFIAPAGTRLFHGLTLSENDRPEHLPYVRAGFAVIAYEIDGNWNGEHIPEAQFLDVLRAFRKAHAGISNAQAAIDYALKYLPQVDPKRLYTAGHSSAGTLSLLVAEYEPRIAACIAYAPCTDVPGQIGTKALSIFDHALPGEEDFLARSSPDADPGRLRCPVFLFHAEDDTNVPIAQTERFAAKVRAANPHVTFIHVPSGGHYDAMIQQGVPRGVEWLQSLSAAPAAAGAAERQ